MYFIMLQMGIQMNYYKQTFAPHIEAIAIRAGLIEENEMRQRVELFGRIGMLKLLLVHRV